MVDCVTIFINIALTMVVHSITLVNIRVYQKLV